MKGPGTNKEQIQVLKEKVGENGVEQANLIVIEYDPNVIALAYKLMRAIINNKNELPKTITKLLNNLSKEDASTIRSKLIEANKTKN